MKSTMWTSTAVLLCPVSCAIWFCFDSPRPLAALQYERPGQWLKKSPVLQLHLLGYWPSALYQILKETCTKLLRVTSWLCRLLWPLSRFPKQRKSQFYFWVHGSNTSWAWTCGIHSVVSKNLMMFGARLSGLCSGQGFAKLCQTMISLIWNALAW